MPIKIRRIEITGTDGYIEVNNISQTVDFFEAIDWRDATDFGEFVERFGEPRKKRYTAEPEEPLKLELQSFLSADYWDETRNCIRETLGDIFILPMCGAAGDQNPLDDVCQLVFGQLGTDIDIHVFRSKQWR